jgi:hypothetical protein
MAGITILRQSLGPDVQKALDGIVAIDEDLAQIFARMEPFRRFSPKAFDDIIFVSLLAIQTRKDAYEHLNATAAFKVRQSYQKIIESVRIFRTLLEKHLSTNIEDFDDVAVDLNAKVDQACLDIIQDHALL